MLLPHRLQAVPKRQDHERASNGWTAPHHRRCAPRHRVAAGQPGLLTAVRDRPGPRRGNPRRCPPNSRGGPNSIRR
jgi:hypothetical protein